jgi:gas vesicle protein
MSRDSAAAEVMLAFLVGAAVGAAVALLFAPAPGQETRDYLAEQARTGREKAAEAAKQGREIINRQRQTITTAIEKGREAYQSARQKETV